MKKPSQTSSSHIHIHLHMRLSFVYLPIKSSLTNFETSSPSISNPMDYSDHSNNRALGRKRLFSDSPAQQYMLSSSQNDQKPDVAMNVDRQPIDGFAQSALSPLQSPAFRHVNLWTRELSHSPGSVGSRRQSHSLYPVTEISNGRESRRRRLNGYSEGRWNLPAGQYHGTASPAPTHPQESCQLVTLRTPISYPWNDSRAVPTIRGPETRRQDDFPLRTSLGVLRPPLVSLPSIEQFNLAPAERRRFALPAETTDSPDIAGLDGFEEVDRWGIRPSYRWIGYLPEIYETRRMEDRTQRGKRKRLIPGGSHIGPPMKPFDDLLSEMVAVEQWRHVVREREMNEARQRQQTWLTTSNGEIINDEALDLS